MRSDWPSDKLTKERSEMLMKKPAVGFRAIIFTAALVIGHSSAIANAATHFHLDKDAQGLIRPFKAVSVPLADFVYPGRRPGTGLS
jgi:hypothetical protein